MLGLPILDVAIGIAFFYLLFALICTTVNEVIARKLMKRPKTLEEAIRQLLGSEALKDELMNHPLICGLSRQEPKKTDKRKGAEIKSGDARSTRDKPVSPPSYIPSSVFATALLDQLTGDNSIRNDQAIRDAISGLPAGGLKRVLTTLYQKAGDDWDAFYREIQNWYDNTMDRAEGWYKRYVQKQTYLLALVIVLWADFDTLHVGRRLWEDSALRSSVVEEAKARAQARNSGDLPLVTYDDPNSPEAGKPVEVERTPLSSTEQSLLSSVTGWQQDLSRLRGELDGLNPAARNAHIAGWFVMHIFGWTISIFAIALGAPFWFDVLNRFMNLRNAGRAPDEPRTKNAGVKTDVQS